MSLSVLVTGATGQQGGALARLLLKKNHKVRALTRNPESAAAKRLRQQGAEIVGGDLEDRSSLQHAMTGVDAAFIVSTSMEVGPDAETHQGITAADAARVAGLGHLVYTSVPRADTWTGVPFFDSKARVEEHIRKLGIPHTIIGPTFFMENLLSPWWLPELRQGRFSIALKPQTRLQIIAVDDIAGFAALVLEHRKEFLGQRIDIASDERTPVEIADTLARTTGRKIEYAHLPIEQVQAVDKGLALMFEWFERVGTGIDVPGLRHRYPEAGWHTLQQWAAKQPWDQALGKAA